MDRRGGGGREMTKAHLTHMHASPSSSSHRTGEWVMSSGESDVCVTGLRMKQGGGGEDRSLIRFFWIK